MQPVKVVSAECPNCKKVLDAVAPVDGVEAQPSPNDVTICFGCSAILYYKEDFSLGLLDEEDLEQMNEETKEQIEVAQKFIKNFKENV